MIMAAQEQALSTRAVEAGIVPGQIQGAGCAGKLAGQGVRG